MARYIDGDKIMEHWQEWDWWDNKGMPHSFGYIPDKALERALENPPELRQLTHAHWIETEDLSGDHYVECSNCCLHWWISGESSKEAEMNYCPRCGARMDEEVDNA